MPGARLTDHRRPSVRMQSFATVGDPRGASPYRNMRCVTLVRFMAPGWPQTR